MKTFATPSRPEARRERACALCGSSSFKPLWDLGSFAFVKCLSCGLVQQNPQPEAGAVLSRYGAEYLAYEVERQYAFRDLESLALGDLRFPAEAGAIVRSALAAGRRPSILDVGCATGALLARFAAEGWMATGVEVCAEAVAWGREHFGLDLKVGTIESAGLASSSFDVVHASHVIEHLNEPASLLAEASRLLRPGGRLIITTPNLAGLQSRLTGAAWRSAINDHLYLFSRRTLTRLLEASGFRVLRTATWGGWAMGLRPAFLKRPLDRLVKPLGAGDVMAMLAIRSGDDLPLDTRTAKA